MDCRSTRSSQAYLLEICLLGDEAYVQAVETSMERTQACSP